MRRPRRTPGVGVDAALLRSDRALGHYTHEKSPLSAVAALATIEIIERDDLLSHASDLGDWAVQQLRTIAKTHDIISDVRGLGLSIGVELYRDGQKACDEADRILYDCLANGLSFKISGGNVLTLTPPLTITREQLDAAIQIIANAIASVSLTVH